MTLPQRSAWGEALEGLARARDRLIAGEGDETVATVALWLSECDHPSGDMAAARHHLDALSCPDTIGDHPIAAIRTMLHQRLGYHGDETTYDDLANARLIDVIQRRRGLPVALGMLWLHMGARLGLDAHGLNLPGHFLIAITIPSGRHLIDPFNDGQEVDTREARAIVKRFLGAEAELVPAYWTPMHPIEVLLRLQNNIKARVVRRGWFERADRVLETMRILAPDQPDIIRESAIIAVQRGHLSAARGHLETLLALDLPPVQRTEASQWLDRLGRRLY